MKQCPECGNWLDDSIDQCTSCGYPNMKEVPSCIIKSVRNVEVSYILKMKNA